MVGAVRGGGTVGKVPTEVQPHIEQACGMCQWETYGATPELPTSGLRSGTHLAAGTWL